MSELKSSEQEQITRAPDVADLDPYKVREKGQEKDAKELLGVDVAEPQTEADEKPKLSQLYKIEQKEWKNILGHKVEIPPVPEIVTEEVRDALEKAGFELRYLPRLNLGDIGWIARLGVNDLKNDLQNSYPNWKNIPEDWFWDEVGERSIDFPFLPGQWVAVENVDDPNKRSFTKDLMQSPHVKTWSWDQVYAAIEARGKGKLAELDLARDAHIRLPDLIEANLIAGRDGYVGGDAYELTDSSYFGKDKKRLGERKPPYILISTNKSSSTYPISSSETGIAAGFRLMIVFDKEQKPPKRPSSVYASPSGLDIVGAVIEVGQMFKDKSINNKRDKRFADIRKPQVG